MSINLRKKLTTEEKTAEFIRRAKIIYGEDKNDYSKVIYVNNNTKVCIICKKHKCEYYQTPQIHLGGHIGCKKCRFEDENIIKNNTLEFIRKAKLVHGDKYDYSKVVYINNRIKVIIICKIHNYEFLQTPKDHLRNSGCGKCRSELISKQKSSNKDIFEHSANIVHNNFYGYKDFIYTKTHEKGIILCPIHGKFEMSASNHLQGQKCPKCSKGENSGIDKKEFEYKSNILHDYKYGYDEFIFVNMSTKGKIFCKKMGHGYFIQTPENHLNRGRGCPKCNYSKGEIIVDRYLNKNNIKYETQHKFEGCVYKRALKFDFYLPEYNTCIEFDGQQHYDLSRYSKDLEKNLKKFEEVKIRDFIKNQYCLDHSIRLIRISYTDIDRIDEILEKELK